MLLVVEPPMYGREAGQSSTIATHQPADTTIATRQRHCQSVAQLGR